MDLLGSILASTIVRVVGSLLTRTDRQRLWDHALRRIESSTRPEDLKVLRGLRGAPLIEHELRRRVRAAFEGREGTRKARQEYADHLVDKLLQAIAGATDDYYAADPLVQYHPFQRFFRELGNELKGQGEDLRGLRKVAESYATEVWPRIQSEVSRLPPAARIWQRLEQFLRQDSEQDFEPRAFRPLGPSWWDFEHHRVYRRVEVHELLERLRARTDGGVYAIRGTMAAGKTVMACHVGFDWIRKAPVFYVNGGDAAFGQVGGPETAQSVQLLAETFSPEGNALPLFIVDDLHRDWRCSTALIQSLTRLSRPRAHVLLVTRPYPESEAPTEHERTQDPLQQADSVLELGPEAFDKAGPQIAQFLWHQKTDTDLPEGEAQHLSQVAQRSLWLLAWLVEGYQGTGRIDRGLAWKEAQRHLARLPQHGFRAAHRVPEALLAVGALSRFEVAVDADFLTEQLADASEIEDTLDGLCQLGELHHARLGLMGGAATQGYMLPHSALGGVYVDAAAAAGPSWPPERRLREMLGDDDWATELLIRRLEQNDTALFVSIMEQLSVGTELELSLHLHSRADSAFLQVSEHILSTESHLPLRNWALHCLRMIPNAQAFELLAQALREKGAPEDNRRSAAYGLVGFGEGAVDALVEALGDDHWRVRDWATFALGEIGSARAVEPLCQRLGDEGEHEHVRWGAAKALGKIGDARATPPLLDALGSKDMNLRYSAAHALGELGDPRAVKALIERLLDEHEDDDVRSAAAYALGDIADPGALDALLEALRIGSTRVRWSAAVALGKIRDPRAVDGLLKALRDEDRGVRAQAAAALGEIGHGAALPRLIAALGDEDPGVAATAAEALGKIKTPQALDHLLSALGDEREAVREGAAWAVGEFREVRTVDALLPLLDDEGYRVPSCAGEALGKIGHARALPALIRVLRSARPFGRLSAAWALGKIGDARAVEPLIDLFRDEDRHREGVASGTAMTLGEAGGWALVGLGDAAVDALNGALEDPDRVVRRFAAVALGHIGTTDAATALRKALQDTDKSVRLQAAEALKRINSADVHNG